MQFPFRRFVTKICWVSTEALLILVAPAGFSCTFFWCTFFFSCTFNVFWTFGFDSVSAIFLTMIRSLLDEGSLNQVFLIWLRCSFFWLDWINVWFLALILIAVFSIRLWFAWFQHKVLWTMCSLDLRISSSDFEQINFCSFFLFLLLVINSVQLSPALSQSATDCANYDIGHYKFMSRHSGVIIIDFDEVPEHALLAIFSWYTFWFGNSVGMIYSRSQELIQDVFLT